jgi:hypothetical protein
MKYQITLASPVWDHFGSQCETHASLCRAGFTNLKWNMGTGRPNGDSLHRWLCEGDSGSVMILRLSADVEKIEELSESPSTELGII